MTIPEVKIHEIKIPTIDNWYFEPPVINKVPKPIVDYPACVKVHRNNLVNQIDIDENGTIIKCGVKMPSYTPLQYTPNEFTYTTPPPKNNTEPPKPPPQQQTDLSNIAKKEKEFFIKCPSDTDPKIGNFANDLKLDKVVGHRLSEDGKTCITLYEPSTFIEKWIPSGPVLVNTSIIAITAASSPILANLLKGVIKNLIKRLQGKKKNVE